MLIALIVVIFLTVALVVFSFGAAAYALKRPNPWPGVIGYHEVFHALTIVGATLHFTAVLQLSS